jgi:hypothetical protein
MTQATIDLAQATTDPDDLGDADLGEPYTVDMTMPGPAAMRGINLPPTQGDTNGGAFLPGVYQWNYSDAQIAAVDGTFNMLRLPINVDTANSPPALAVMKGYVDQLASKSAIICMFGTRTATSTHGTGYPDDLVAAGAAWANVHAVFGSYPNVHYELFNEPFGYDRKDPAHYVSDMKAIITSGGLPPNKCILDGLGYADDVQSVAAAGWSGDLAFHFYPNWSSVHTEAAYSSLVQTRLAHLAQRTWITEFGANLGYNNPCWTKPLRGSLREGRARLNS